MAVVERRSQPSPEPSAQEARPDERAVYVISVAAELAGVHPQTLRIYERKGLLRPARTAGNTRRYSERDIARLRMIQRLTQELGLNLAGVQMVLEMEDQVERLRRHEVRLTERLREAQARLERELARLAADEQRTAIVPRSEIRRARIEVRRAQASANVPAASRRPIALGPPGGASG
jgi:MerR family transcriptional regulator/heat shock protein HspR